MTPPDTQDLLDAPELAIVQPTLACFDALIASLAAQHGTLHEPWYNGDPPSLMAARTLVRDLTKARLALARYLRAVRHVHRFHDDEALPF